MKRLVIGSAAGGLMLACLVPATGLAAGGPPTSLFGICQGQGTGGADPVVSPDHGGAYGPIVIFDDGSTHTPLGRAPVFLGAGACTFTQPAN